MLDYTVTQTLSIPATPAVVIIYGDCKPDHWVFTAKLKDGRRLRTVGAMKTSSLPPKPAPATAAALDWVSKTYKKYLVLNKVENSAAICITVEIK